MKKMIAFGVICLGLFFLGYQYIFKEKIMKTQKDLHVYLGESFEEFNRRNPVKRKYKKPSGSDIMFYKYNRPSNPPASMTFHYSNNEIVINNFIYMRVTEDLRDNSGVGDIYIQAGITPAGWMPHTEARIKFQAFLQTLLDKGWKQAQSYEDPRLRGTQALSLIHI